MLLRDFVNKKIASADKEASAEGVPLTLNNCKKYKKMRDLKVYGNTIQDGTPTPDAPIEIQSVGELVTDETDANYGKYKIPITVRGKNYFNMRGVSTEPRTSNGITFTPLGDERIHVKGTLADTTKEALVSFSKWCKLPKGVYRAKPCKHSAGYKFHINYGVILPDGSVFNIQGYYGSGNAKEISVDGANIQYLQLSISPGNTTEFDDIIELQVEKGTEYTDYEPYVKPVTTNIYLNEPLYKLNTFADYIDFKNNKVVRNCRKKDMSTYTYYLGGTYTKNDEECYWFAAGDETVRPNSTLTKPYANMALSNIMPVYGTYNHESYSYGILTYSWGSNIRVSIPLSYIGEATVTAFKNWLKTHNAYEIRVLATPKEEAIDIELPKLNAKTTIIEVDTSPVPSNMSGKYITR